MNHSKKFLKYHNRLLTTTSCSCSNLKNNEKLVVLLTQRRNFSKSASLKKKKDLEKEEKLPVFDYGKFHPERKRVYVFGQAGHGGLGLTKLLMPNDEDLKQVYFMHRPVRHHFAESHKVIDIAAGHGFTLMAVKPEKENNFVIFGCGNNIKSQLGFQPDPKDKPLACLVSVVPIPLPLDKTSKILALGAGRGHSIISVEGKGLIALGDNSYGQCGRNIIPDEEYMGSKYISRVPRFGTTHEYDVIQMASRFDVNVCLTRMGTVHTFGCNDQGQLGRGKEIKKTWIAAEVQGDLKGQRVKKVVTSGASCLAITDKGELFGWGSNDCGQVDPSTISNIYYEPIHVKIPRRCGKIIDVAIGNMFTFILNEYGKVYAWGTGYSLGLGPKQLTVRTPTLLPPPLFGRHQFSPDTAVVKIAASSTFAAAVNCNGDLYTWGENDNGCLGLGKLRSNYQFFPFKVALGVPVRKICLGADHVVLMTKGSF